ncbi:FGGY-family carbohydrate kinase [Actinotalea subterranea]|uniref:FGGY-family carbohydrate kinase n=1 Tax=Actinotalea subterranea TaxID=2607497 RepID=UPI0011EE8EF7|nr:FGGY-family carbohydrate kinase [Actinotalea subterranea]
MGTAEAVLTVLSSPPDPRRTADAGMSWVRTVSGVHDAVLAGTSSAGAMLGWLAERVGPGALEGALAEAARQHAADPTPTGVIVLPYLAGRQTPAPDASARVRVFPADIPRSELVRAVAEGVCLQARWMLDAQAVLAGRGGGASHEGARAGSPLRVLGGPAMAIPLWAETKRRVTPGSLRWVRAEEPVAMGAGLLALTRSGVLGADVGRLLSGEAPVLDSVDDQPRPAGRRAPGPGAGEYDAMYERFVAAALEPAQPA